MADQMELDEDATLSTSNVVSSGDKKRFEVKKWSAVALWAWGIVNSIYFDLKVILMLLLLLLLRYCC
jgi:hypothetical protein